MSNHCLILIYDNYLDIDKLIRYRSINELYPVIIASFNTKFLKQINNLYPEYETILIEEKAINVFDVSDVVIKTIKSINISIENNIDPEKILYFQKHIEGGYTSGRVQELVIIERFIINIIRKYNIKQIYDYFDIDYRLESEVFKTLSKQKAISYKRISRFSQNIRSLRYRFIPFLYEPYRLVNSFRIKTMRHKNNPVMLGSSIVLCLESSANKFLELYSSFCEKLGSINVPFYYLTSTINKNDPNVRSISDKIYLLENYETLIDYLISYIRTFKYICKYYYKRNNILNDISPNNSLIRSHLFRAIFYHIIIDTGHRYRYRKSMLRFIGANGQHIKAIKLWGETSLVQGEILCDIIRNGNTHIKTLGFEVGIGLKTFPYISDNINNVDYYITSNDIETDVYLSHGVQKHRILQLADFKHKYFIDNHKKNHSKHNSKITLGITGEYNITVLFDISIALRGYQSTYAINNIISIIPILAEKHSDILFLIKPHPRFKHQSYFTNYTNLANIKIFSNNISILHLLNISDILVTKSSAIGHEALLFNKLVISIIDDEKFKAYEDSAIYIEDIEKLSTIIENYPILQKKYKQSIRRYNKRISNVNQSININQVIRIIDGES